MCAAISNIGGPAGLLKALIIEDNACMSDVISKTLKHAGFQQVKLATGLGQVVDLLQREPEAVHDFELIICDLVLTDADGFRVLSYLGEYGYCGRVILVSGMDRRLLETAQIQAESSGLEVAGILNKPFSIHQLLALARMPGKKRPEARQPRVELEDTGREFSAALSAGEIRAAFHPILDPITQQLIAIEALARWNHPEVGLVSPADFLPVVENSDVSYHFLLVMLQQCLEAQRKLAHNGIDVQAAVNVASAQLTGPLLPAMIAAKVSEFGVRPEQVVLEITETQGIGDPPAAIENLNRLRLMGFRLSVDDYGTGFSSLERVRRLPFTDLKVDRQFVHDASSRRDLVTILRHCMELGRQLDLQVIAEGVETREDWQLIQSLGFDGVQGFYFARPMPLEELMDWSSQQLGLPQEPPLWLDQASLLQYTARQM